VCAAIILFYNKTDGIIATVYRFRRRVMLPRGVEPDYVTSTITSDGVLTVLAPKLTLEGRLYPIK